MNSWTMGGIDGRTLVLSPETSERFVRDGKVRREIEADALVIAGVMRDEVTVMGARGGVLMVVAPVAGPVTGKGGGR
jgi:hypothetical protein